MYCSRLDHFVRFNPDGTVSRCGHMVSPPRFANLQELDASSWLTDIRLMFDKDIWPKECQRCKDTEVLNGTSIRLNSLHQHADQSPTNYLQVGGVLDNICNSACQFCNSKLSTKIGSLYNAKSYPVIDNSQRYWSLPLDRVTLLDINGGEPSASRAYRKVLENLPPNLKTLRINTNASIVIQELDQIADKGVEVIVTISLDGVGSVHDYVRWPIKWNTFRKNVDTYHKFQRVKINFWTTLNAYNVYWFDDILHYINTNKFDHSYALLSDPHQLNLKFKNFLTNAAKVKYTNHSNPELAKISNMCAIDKDNEQELQAFIQHNDRLRSISISDYLKFSL